MELRFLQLFLIFTLALLTPVRILATVTPPADAQPSVTFTPGTGENANTASITAGTGTNSAAALGTTTANARAAAASYVATQALQGKDVVNKDNVNQYAAGLGKTLSDQTTTIDNQADQINSLEQDNVDLGLEIGLGGMGGLALVGGGYAAIRSHFKNKPTLHNLEASQKKTAKIIAELARKGVKVVDPEESEYAPAWSKRIPWTKKPLPAAIRSHTRALTKEEIAEINRQEEAKRKRQRVKTLRAMGTVAEYQQDTAARVIDVLDDSKHPAAARHKIDVVGELARQTHDQGARLLAREAGMRARVAPKR